MSATGQRIAGRSPKAITQRFRDWLRAKPVGWQFGWGSVIAFPPIGFQLGMIWTGHEGWTIVGLALSVIGAIAASWLMRPWFEELPRKQQRRITALPLIAYIILSALWVLLSLLLAPENRPASAVLLFMVWAYHSLYGSGLEPHSSAYERLRGRLLRAAPLRVAVNWTGLAGVLIVLQASREKSDYPAVFLALMGTVTLACVGASIKVFIRVHRLSANLDQHADKVILELQKLRALPEDKRTEQKFAVEEAWGTLRRTLANKIDTGLSISGVFVLPSATIKELHHQVHRAIRAAGTDDNVHRQVTARLRILRIACVGRTDTLV